ncbi:hypothetical protein Q7A53_16955 [Halobacillus rhizosphaerae]|uniref:hypothetical protein n=1 Tax=Halobacillus rhizosphaerae TaxID=3064889 RepID=UPI00398B6525
MKMLNIAKKLLIFTGIIVTGALGFTSTNVDAASNYGDTHYYMEFNNLSFTSHDVTPDREKWDATSSYMKTDYVGAANDADYKFTGYVEKDNGVNLDNNGAWRYEFGDHTTHFLSNYAYENYGYGVLIHIRGEAGWNRVDVGTGGVWSPDSI